MERTEIDPARPLLGQKAIVTGASSGIGRAVALALGKAGAEVVVNHRDNAEGAVAVTREIVEAGGRAWAIRADVSLEDDVLDLFRRGIAELGTVDILVNNAGLQRDAPFDEMTLEQWNTVIAVNLTGQFLCARPSSGSLARDGKDHLHQLGARSDPLGGARQLRRIEGGRDDDDEDAGARGGAAQDPREQHRAGRDPDAHQHSSVEHSGGV